MILISSSISTNIKVYIQLNILEEFDIVQANYKITKNMNLEFVNRFENKNIEESESSTFPTTHNLL